MANNSDRSDDDPTDTQQSDSERDTQLPGAERKPKRRGCWAIFAGSPCPSPSTSAPTTPGPEPSSSVADPSASVMTLNIDLPGYTLPIPEASSETPPSGAVPATNVNLTRRAVEQKVYNYTGQRRSPEPTGVEVPTTTTGSRLSVMAPSMVTSTASAEHHQGPGRNSRFSMVSMASMASSLPDSMYEEQSQGGLPGGLTAVPRRHLTPLQGPSRRPQQTSGRHATDDKAGDSDSE